MSFRRIRLCMAILAVSFITLMASASEAQAARWAFCKSGRCIRSVGIANVEDSAGRTFTGSAVAIVDLVYRYFVVDTPSSTIWLAAYVKDVNIAYNRLEVYIYKHGSGPGWSFDMDCRFRVGLPGFLVAQWHETYPDGWHSFEFAGLASFYNRMEYVPWWHP